MSGTSLDGIDVAICRFPQEGKVDLLFHDTFEWQATLRTQLLALVGAESANVDAITELNFELARAYAEATKEALVASGVTRDKVRAIGLHGQTIRHLPLQATWQLGSGPALAALTQIDVVHDFRSADVALGGQGAPLVPMFDLLFLTSTEKDRLVTNIGGITNVTFIPMKGDVNGSNGNVIAYDTGPGNMIIDVIAQRYFDRPFDANGQIGQSGNADTDLLNELLAHSYFRIPPPKSTGRELLQRDFIPRFINAIDSGALTSTDAITTATELTARTLASASNGTEVEVVLSGGGAKNGFLVERISALLPNRSSVSLSHDLGIDTQAKESIAFAFFAKARIDETMIHLPKTTGASRHTILGSVAIGRSEALR